MRDTAGAKPPPEAHAGGRCGVDDHGGRESSPLAVTGSLAPAHLTHLGQTSEAEEVGRKEPSPD